MTLETTLQSVLTDAQQATLEEAMAEHRAAVSERRLEKLDAGVQRRVEFLNSVLELTDAQFAQVESILTATLPERRTILEALRDGSIEIEDALYQGYVLAEQTAASIRAVLTAEQTVVFDALKKLLPGHRGPKGP